MSAVELCATAVSGTLQLCVPAVSRRAARGPRGPSCSFTEKGFWALAECLIRTQGRSDTFIIDTELGHLVVKPNNVDGLYGLNYAGFIPCVLKANNELNERFNLLEEKGVKHLYGFERY